MTQFYTVYIFYTPYISFLLKESYHNKKFLKVIRWKIIFIFVDYIDSVYL